MKYPMGAIRIFYKDQIVLTKVERVRREIISERVRKDKSLTYIDGVGAPQSGKKVGSLSQNPLFIISSLTKQIEICNPKKK